MIGKASEKSKSGDWWTPDHLYESICRMTGIFPQLDVAADAESRKCINYFSEQYDALNQDWILTNISTNTTKKNILKEKTDVWCNPPGDKVQKFVDKALEQWTKWDINIVMLIPVNTITNKNFENVWKLAMSENTIDIIPLFGQRPNFLLNGKLDTKYGSRNGYIVLVFRKRT